MANKWETQNMTVDEIFDHYTKKSDQCWIWQGTKNHNGYGLIAIGGGRKMLAHRWSFIRHRGGLIDGFHVCHTCDTPSCVNPSHLFAGTDADNNTDKAKKLRAGKVLKPEQVQEIKKILKESPVPLHVIAMKFNCSRKSIQRIKNGQYWRYA